MTGNAAVSEDKLAAEANVSAAAGTAVDAAGAAAIGLCTAFTNGGLNASSEGFSSLVIAAKGEGNVEAFCTDVVAKGTAAAEAKAAGEGSAAVQAERPNCRQFPRFRQYRASTACPSFPPFLLLRPCPQCPRWPAMT